MSDPRTLLGNDKLVVDRSDWLESLAVAAHDGVPEGLLAWEWYGEINAQRYGVLVVDFEYGTLTGQAFTAKPCTSAVSIHCTAARS